MDLNKIQSLTGYKGQYTLNSDGKEKKCPLMQYYNPKKVVICCKIHLWTDNYLVLIK